MSDAPMANRWGARVVGPSIIHLLRASVLNSAWAIMALLAVAAIVHATGVRLWPFELVHHFIPAYTLAAALAFLLALLLRNLRLTAIGGLLFAFFAWALAGPLSPLAPPPPPVIEASNAPPAAAGSLPPVVSTAPHGDPEPSVASPAPGGAARPLSIITNNVYCANWNRNGLISWLRTRPADVVVLQEVPPFIDKLLADVGDAYPFTARISSSGPRLQGIVEACQGIVVLSTLPIAKATAFQPIKNAWPALFARLQVGETAHVSLAVVHAADPIRAEGLDWRDRFFDLLATHLRTIHGPLIVLGDFNASPYTPAFRDFLVQAGLMASPWNPGTYPAKIGTFGISIDHVLVRDATLLRLDPLPAIGSDHRPLRALIALPDAPEDFSGLADGSGLLTPPLPPG